MESALDVLSRAATMVQDNANESRLINKELPTSAWRRDRRLRTGEYHHPNHYPLSNLPTSGVHTISPSSSPPPNAHAQHTYISSGTVSNTNAHQISMMMAAAASIHPLCESTKQSASTTPNSNLAKQTHFDQISITQGLQQTIPTLNDDAPLDMSVGNLKQRSSPPPPYREPLPGSQYSSSLARPSVITQAPPKRDTGDSILVINRENDNRSCESIDEHFRRSLGNEYFSLFTKTCSTSHSTVTLSSQPQNLTPLKAHIRSSSPTLPLSSGKSVSQSELSSPPAYPVNFQSVDCQYVHKNQLMTTTKGKKIPVSPTILASQTNIPTGPSSPPLPLVVRPNLMQNQHHTVSQKCSSLQAKTPLASSQSPVHSASIKLGNNTQTSLFSTSVTRTGSPIPLQQHPSSVTISLSHLSSLDNSPSSSPRHTPPVHNVLVSNTSSSLPAIMRIKTEPGLQNINSKKTSPPASPTLATNYASNCNPTACSTHISSPPSSKSNWKAPSNSGNTSTEVIASVDDHFAKALGDTWKKLQEKTELHK